MLRDRKNLLSWALYDWANSAFSAIIQTFIFAVYFTQQLTSDPAIGSALWGGINGTAALIIAILGPILGAVADHGGKRKAWLGLFTLLCIVCTGTLSFAKPPIGNLFSLLTVLTTAIAASELAFVFYNAMLPNLAPHSHIGRWSGWGWGLGYAGGMLSLLISLSIIQFGYPVQLTFLFCAAWYLIFSIPLFLFTPPTSGLGKPLLKAVFYGMKQLIETLRQMKQYKEIVKFLIARMFYMDGLTTLFAFGGVYAATTFNMPQSEILLFGIMTNISAGIGAVGFAWIDDRIGPRKLILISLAGITLPTLWILLIPYKLLFWILALFAGLFVGPLQASSRSLMAHLAPKHLYNEMFGFFALSGKATSFLGPWIVSWLILEYGSMRIGLAVVVAFYTIGGILMLFIED
ncbi:permease, major facilitator superfamily [Waddlia chondrophila 2032/99]|uniref:Permease, major facilitator superfamily n=1 Tax=Waddlia chondrophila 2032/99 TaxID=765953 RepID=F8LDV0_9BACT|nr:permease, major facilitator superfamily [Waddlia chondrophila 2032/99]